MSVNKVQLANGETIIDISDSTVTPETLAEGVTAHDASGQKITGKMAPGGGSSVQSDWNQTDETAADFIKNKPIVIVNIDFETLVLDKTPAEIDALMVPGNIVLFSMTCTPFSVAVNADGSIEITTTYFAVTGTTMTATTYFFDKDGYLINQELVAFEGTLLE